MFTEIFSYLTRLRRLKTKTYKIMLRLAEAE